MTATLQPRPTASDPAATAPPPAPPPRSPESSLIEVAAEVSLVLVTLAAVVSLGRLFADSSFLGPVILAAVGAHVLAWGARRFGLGLGAAAVVSGLGLLLVIAYVIEPHTLTGGLPLAKTWTAANNDLSNALERFNSVVPPAPVTRGFILASAIAAWVCAFIADTAAFRVLATFESVIPSFTIFLFGSVLAFNRNRLAMSALYLASVLLFVLFVGAARREETANWLAGRRGPGSKALVGRGLVVGAVAVIVAVSFGPDLPGAGGTPVFNWRNRDNGPSSRTTISPLVDIRTRLVDQTDNELFTVQSTAPEYWRITALDKFDGKIWSSVGTYKPAGGSLPSGVRSRAATDSVTQQFAISGLSSIWLPAAYRPTRLDGVKKVRYDAESSSLLTDAETSNGLNYKVESALPQLSPNELSTAPNAYPQAILDRYLDLPADFPSSVRGLARRIVASASTPYAKARALQDYLRTNYTYDLRVPAGHDENALTRFLFTTKRGYCEQFSGSYAAMARAVGLPSRVAVGFTPGQAAAGGTYRVLNRHAHAWPEVYLSGYGWVAFEPTPGRGSPDDSSYTGVAPPTPETVAVPPSLTQQPPPTTVPQGESSTPTTTPAGEQAQQAKPHHRSGWITTLLVLAGIVVLVGAVLAVLVLRRRRAIERRRGEATTPDERALVAWEEAEEALALAGYPRKRAETPDEYARRIPPTANISPEPMHRLASSTSVAAYSAGGVTPEGAAAAGEAAGVVRTQLAQSASRFERLRWALGVPSKREAAPPKMRMLESLIPGR